MHFFSPSRTGCKVNVGADPVFPVLRASRGHVVVGRDRGGTRSTFDVIMPASMLIYVTSNTVRAGLPA